MIFDAKLMFLNEEAIQDFSGGELGKALDLGVPSQMRGRPCYVAIQCADNTTATGDPEISFALETSGTEDFLEVTTIPLSIPKMKKGDLKAGAAFFAPCPLYSLRFVRLVLETSLPITCAELSAGIVLDPQI